MKLILDRIFRAPEDGTGAAAAAPVAADPAAAAAPPAAAPAAAASAAPAAAPPAATILGAEAVKAAAPAAAAAPPADAPAEFVPDPAKTPEENETAKAAHEAAAKAKVEEKPKVEEPKDERTAEEIQAAADAFEITPPEGFELSPEVEKPFRSFAAKHKLSQDEVKELTDLQVKLYADQAASHARQVEEWGKATRAHKEIGGPNFDENSGKAAAFLNEFFPPEAAALLDKTGLGNHPDFVVGFVRAGIAMGEIPTFRQAAGAMAGESVQDILYPVAAKA